ncbi:MAG: sigma-70 family RNA polymerase sigma factor [Chloroflexi bacterium]|nr:sigma-70 family RNA polymerase sigma factor [Chloroflexota bacterium]MBV9601999.1 sigma-70 family RNA polymerase sigma factor [Chloroflexota bacterium]
MLVHCARARLRREQRSIPFSAMWDAATERFEAAVAAERFRGPGEQWSGGWVSFPPAWGEAPEERLLSREARGQIQAAIDRLPPSQREVVLLRDVQGWSAAEVCDALMVSEANQRVLLHRGRSKVRQALEAYLSES